MSAVVSGSSTGEQPAMRTHWAGWTSRTWKKRSSGSTELSNVWWVRPRARAAKRMSLCVAKASWINGTASPLVNPHKDVRVSARQCVSTARCRVAASVMNNLIWPTPQFCGTRTKKYG